VAGSCTASKCHGAGTPTWGGPSLKCSDCHTGAADTDSLAFGTAGIINTTEWTGSGHGNATLLGVNALPTIAAGQPCLYCHDGDVSHDVTGNPFRLNGATPLGGVPAAGSYVVTTDTLANAPCLNCHGTGSNGVNAASQGLKTATKKVDAWHLGTKHTTTFGGRRCWDCHDPHGDGNVKMVGKTVVKVPNDLYSFANAPTARVTGVTFTANATGTDYANASTSSVCRACHTTALHYNATTNDGHNSGAKCVACHGHDNANPAYAFQQSTACNACHNAPPTLGKHGIHDATTFAETSYTNNVRHASATQYGFACNTCHNGTHMNGNNPYTAQVVFGSFDTTAVGGTYVAGTAQTADTAPTGLLTFNWTGGTCNTTYCHSNGSPVGGTVAYAAPKWTDTWAAGTQCLSCHKMSATATVPDTNLSHSHQVHTGTNAANGYFYNCSQCHNGVATGASDYPTTAGVIVDRTKHVSGPTHNVAFDVTFNPGTTGYVQAPTYTCSNTYCHSNGTNAASPPANTSIAWTATKAADCSSCHGGNSTAAVKMATNDHAAHVNQAAGSATPYLGSNIPCGRCHAATVDQSNDRAIKTLTNHVNRLADVSIVNADATAGGTYSGSATKQCSSTYCHSDGTETPGNFTTMDWDLGTALPNDCKQCHGKAGGAFVSIAGEPNYTERVTTLDDVRNSHSKHVKSAADCVSCHDATVDATGALIAGSFHLNKVGDVSAGAGKKIAGTYTQLGETCTSITCHGGGTAQWGGTMSCLDCHSGSDTTLSNGSPNGVSTYWTVNGHGSAAGGAFTSSLGGCDYCHQLDSGHTPTDATNPYRLRYSATANTLCLQCHQTGDAGINANSAGTALTLENSTLNVDAAHDGAKHSAGEGGMFCWDCHDPHGVLTNIKMIKPAIQQASNTYGVPVTTKVVTFTNNACTSPAVGCNVEATNNPRRGVCQACHDPAKATTQSTKYWRWDGTDDPDGAGGAAAYTSSHNSTKDCGSCHAHKDKFAGKGGGSDCIGCHGAAGQGSRRAITADFGLQSHHVRTVATLTATGAGTFSGTATGVSVGNNYDCVVCHAEGQIITGASADCTTSPFTTCTNPSYHANGKIDLRNVDNAPPAVDGALAAAVFVYDKTKVAGSAGAAANWSSSNQLWREWTSGVNETGNDGTEGVLPTNAGLDKFCLNCHDADGALQISTFRISTETSRTALDPFWDGLGNIGNTYDQYNRSNQTGAIYPPVAPPASGGHVIDIKSKVSGAPPAQGSFARHAIRGQSTSKYVNYTTAAAWPSNPNAYATLYSAGKFMSAGTDEAGRPNWNDASVMGCADCHTTDGANGSSGNAHGSTSEYLLKDGAGTAAEGSYTLGNENCARCHNNYGTAHTGGNGSDFQENLAGVGAARMTGTSKGMGSIFGLACMNCHGGAQGNGSVASDSNGFGWIHGTSQVFPTGADGGAGTRNAYRFLNGSSLRFYTPGNANWDSGTGTCITLNSKSASFSGQWGTCTQHSGGTAAGPLTKRPLTY
jgi:predicted CxxxxCH...CXXCH cytochrome family protein